MQNSSKQDIHDKKTGRQLAGSVESFFESIVDVLNSLKKVGKFIPSLLPLIETILAIFGRGRNQIGRIETVVRKIT